MEHQTIMKLKNDIYDSTISTESFKSGVELLYETDIISSGQIQGDPSQFSKKVYGMIAMGLGQPTEEKTDIQEDTEVQQVENLEEID